MSSILEWTEPFCIFMHKGQKDRLTCDNFIMIVHTYMQSGLLRHGGGGGGGGGGGEGGGGTLKSTVSRFHYV